MKRKFYATLPHKIDAAVEDYKKQTEHSDPEITSSYLEEGTFRENGWYIRRSLDEM